MDLNRYQEQAAKTAFYPEQIHEMVVKAMDDRDSRSITRVLELSYVAMGMAGEAGEFANKVKKIIRDHGGVIDKDTEHELAEELGDILWYAADAARIMGWKLATIALRNILKLSRRMSVREMLSAKEEK